MTNVAIRYQYVLMYSSWYCPARFCPVGDQANASNKVPDAQFVAIVHGPQQWSSDLRISLVVGKLLFVVQ